MVDTPGTSASRPAYLRALEDKILWLACWTIHNAGKDRDGGARSTSRPHSVCDMAGRVRASREWDSSQTARSGRGRGSRDEGSRVGLLREGHQAGGASTRARAVWLRRKPALEAQHDALLPCREERATLGITSAWSSPKNCSTGIVASGRASEHVNR
jgi:hypothetical protein